MRNSGTALAMSHCDSLDRATEMNWMGRRMDARAARDRRTRRRGPLSDLPFLVKDLFAIEGEPTIAASATQIDTDAAASDAFLISRLNAAGAILLGTTNMDSLAYGFVTSTEMYGTARNPYDPERLCGGSSGGSAAAVAGGVVPFALGTDTSGSVRVPSALCGALGLKPSFGRLSTRGVWPLAPSLDHCGLFADHLDRMEQVYGVLAVDDPEDPRQRLFSDDFDANPVRFGLLSGYFERGLSPAVDDAVCEAARAVDAQRVPCPGARARAAAYITVAAEAADTHSKALSRQRDRFDPAVRDRLTAGLLVPRSWLDDAAAIASDYKARFERLFTQFDILLAPAVPCTAPRASDAMACLPGTTMPLRAALGLYTQPLSLTGLPILSLPLATAEGLPTAIQIIAPMGCEARLFNAARTIAAACPLSTPFLSQPNPRWSLS